MENGATGLASLRNRSRVTEGGDDAEKTGDMRLRREKARHSKARERGGNSICKGFAACVCVCVCVFNITLPVSTAMHHDLCQLHVLRNYGHACGSADQLMAPFEISS